VLEVQFCREMQEEGANITVNSVHPGLIMTNLMRHSAFLMSTLYITLIQKISSRNFWVLIGIFFFWLAGILRVFTCLLWKNVPQVTTISLGPSKYIAFGGSYRNPRVHFLKSLSNIRWQFLITFESWKCWLITKLIYFPGGSYNLLRRPPSKFKGSDWKVLLWSQRV